MEPERGQEAQVSGAARKSLQARCAARVVTDANGGVVLVYEPELKDQARVLVFEAYGSSVHVARFPAEWRKLADLDLLALRPPRD